MLRRLRILVPLAVSLCLAGLFPSVAGAHPAYGLVRDERGFYYFSDLEAVWKVAPDGVLSVFRPPVAGTHVHELTLTPSGALRGDEVRYDPSSKRFYSAIWERSSVGNEHYVISPTDRPPTGSGVLVDRNGDSYTSQWLSREDRRTLVFRRSASGRSMMMIGEQNMTGGFRQSLTSSIGGIIFNGGEGIIFADGRRLRRASFSGRSDILFSGNARASFRGLSLEPSGAVLVADMGNAQILAIAPGGKASRLHQSPEGWTPTAVSGPREDLVILEAELDPAHRSHRVRLVRVTPQYRILAFPGQSPTANAMDGERSIPFNPAIFATGTLIALTAAWAMSRRRRRPE